MIWVVGEEKLRQKQSLSTAIVPPFPLPHLHYPTCVHLSNHKYFVSSTGGLILFAIFSLVMDVFKIGYYSSFYSCLSAIKIIYPIVQAIFVVVQVSCRGTEPPGEGAPVSRT